MTVLYQTPWGTWESLSELTEGGDIWSGIIGLDFKIFGAGGNDTLYGAGGRDFLAGGNGHDRIYGGSGSDNLFGDAGNDMLVGGTGYDQLYGGEGDDILYSFGDTRPHYEVASVSDAVMDDGGFMNGGIGNDTLYVDTAIDGSLSIDGGAGNDIVRFNADMNIWSVAIPTSVPVNRLDLETGNGTTSLGGTLTVARVEHIVGGEYRDHFMGNDQANELRGGNNNDYLEGRGGADRLDGGNGYDSAQYVSASSGVTVDLSLATQAATYVVNGVSVSNGDAAGDILVSIEDLRGSNYADILKGRTTTGASSNESFLGNSGSDFIEGRTGGDFIDGGTGFDFASYERSSSGVSISLARGSAVSSAQFGDAAGDSLVNIEGLIGSAYGDILNASDANNELRGNAGNDQLRGYGGNDIIDGGSGSDKIWGGTGRDSLTGGTGSDTFVFALGDSNGSFNQRDVINGFQRDMLLGSVVVQGDLVDLSGIDARSATTANEAFTFIGDQGFVGAGQVRVTKVLSANGVDYYNLVQAEVNGDGIADLQVSVYASPGATLTSADFLL